MQNVKLWKEEKSRKMLISVRSIKSDYEMVNKGPTYKLYFCRDSSENQFQLKMPFLGVQHCVGTAMQHDKRAEVRDKIRHSQRATVQHRQRKRVQHRPRTTM